MENPLKEVHRYWFGDSVNDLEAIQQKGKLWFGKDENVDRYIRESFSDLILAATNQQIPLIDLDSSLQLAVILLLDQFPRNIYRNDPRCFASDAVARQLAQQLLDRSGGLRPIEKVFLYLPLEHSENLDDQKKSVALYRSLHETVVDEVKEHFGGFFDYALRHHDIIARFGRFPHRNTVLQRKSTPEEIKFLSQPGSSF